MIFVYLGKDNKYHQKNKRDLDIFQPPISQHLSFSDLNKERRIKFSSRRIVMRLYIFIVDNVC